MNFVLILLASASLLTVFKAPALPLWYLAIAVSEAGHYFALVCVVLAIALGFQKEFGLVVLLCLSALLYVTPVLRATQLARHMNLIPDYRKLFFGEKLPPVDITTQVFARHSNEDLALDIYREPGSIGARPGILVIHGGSWTRGRRDDLHSLSRYLVGKGYVVVAPQYRFAPKFIFPAQQADIFAAIDYVKANAKDLGINPRELFLLGRSAGGQLALSAAYGRKDSDIKGVIAFYAPSDLVWGYTLPSNLLVVDSQKALEIYLGGKPDVQLKNFEAASPVYHVSADSPPTFMIHGDLDVLVSPKHNERLSDRLKEAGRPYTYIRLPWATHACDAIWNGPSGQLSTLAVERFLKDPLSEKILPSKH